MPQLSGTHHPAPQGSLVVDLDNHPSLQLHSSPTQSPTLMPSPDGITYYSSPTKGDEGSTVFNQAAVVTCSLFAAPKCQLRSLTPGSANSDSDANTSVTMNGALRFFSYSGVILNGAAALYSLLSLRLLLMEFKKFKRSTPFCHLRVYLRPIQERHPLGPKIPRSFVNYHYSPMTLTVFWEMLPISH
ncbi:hypothetical protein FRC02_003591 [Tulasnella sp. 418]|nr:hypothetical protein FRC02_003591 [Tulasnella sp. 418]